MQDIILKKEKSKDHNRLHNIGTNYLGTVLEKIEEQEYNSSEHSQYGGSPYHSPLKKNKGGAGMRYVSRNIILKKYEVILPLHSFQILCSGLNITVPTCI